MPYLQSDRQINRLLLQCVENAVQRHLALRCHCEPVQHLFPIHRVIDVQSALVTIFILKFIEVIELEHVETVCVVQSKLHWCLLRVLEDQFFLVECVGLE